MRIFSIFLALSLIQNGLVYIPSLGSMRVVGIDIVLFLDGSFLLSILTQRPIMEKAPA